MLLCDVRNGNLLVGGSTHEGTDGLSDVREERQCTFMSLPAFLCQRSLYSLSRSTGTVDEIFIKENSTYLEAFEQQTISDTVTDRPDRACLPSPPLVLGFGGDFEFVVRQRKCCRSDVPAPGSS